MAAAAQKQILASLKGFLKSGAYSDLTITCGSDTYKVHKVIVCERAEFFSRTLKFGGKVIKESESGVIDLPEDEPAIVKLLIQYLYEAEYEPLLPDTESSVTSKPSRPTHDGNGNKYKYDFPHTCDVPRSYCTRYRVCPHHNCKNGGTCGSGLYANSCSNFNCEKCNPLPSLNGTSDQLLLHAQMYEIADKYDVVGLQKLVIEKFQRACEHFWNDAKFSVAVHHIFSTTPDYDKGLRDIVSATISAHMSLVKKYEVRILMAKFNGLALGILEEKIKENGW